MNHVLCVLSRYKSTNTRHLHGAQHSWIMMWLLTVYVKLKHIFFCSVHTNTNCHTHQALLVNSTENYADRTLSLLEWMCVCIFPPFLFTLFAFPFYWHWNATDSHFFPSSHWLNINKYTYRFGAFLTQSSQFNIFKVITTGLMMCFFSSLFSSLIMSFDIMTIELLNLNGWLNNIMWIEW